MRLSLLILCCILALGSRSHASTITGSGGGFSGSGTLTTTSNGDGSSTITAISGAASGIDYLLGVGAFNNNDNQLYPNGASLVDSQGFAFEDTQGSTSYMVDILTNPASSTGYSAYLLDSDGYTGSVDVTFALSASAQAQAISSVQSSTYNFSFSPAAVASTPEPSSFLLLGTGMIGAFGTVWRRRG